MMHYNKIARFLQTLKKNLFIVEINFIVVYRVTCFIDKKTSMITFANLFASFK